MTGTELRFIRKALGMTQRALSDALGIHVTTVNRMERSVEGYPIELRTELAVQYLFVMDRLK